LANGGCTTFTKWELQNKILHGFPGYKAQVYASW